MESLSVNDKCALMRKAGDDFRDGLEQARQLASKFDGHILDGSRRNLAQQGLEWRLHQAINRIEPLLDELDQASPRVSSQDNPMPDATAESAQIVVLQTQFEQKAQELTVWQSQLEKHESKLDIRQAKLDIQNSEFETRKQRVSQHISTAIDQAVEDRNEELDAVLSKLQKFLMNQHQGGEGSVRHWFGTMEDLMHAAIAKLQKPLSEGEIQTVKQLHSKMEQLNIEDIIAELKLHNAQASQKPSAEELIKVAQPALEAITKDMMQEIKSELQRAPQTVRSGLTTLISQQITSALSGQKRPLSMSQR